MAEIYKIMPDTAQRRTLLMLPPNKLVDMGIRDNYVWFHKFKEQKYPSAVYNPSVNYFVKFFNKPSCEKMLQKIWTELGTIIDRIFVESVTMNGKIKLIISIINNSIFQQLKTPLQKIFGTPFTLKVRGDRSFGEFISTKNLVSQLGFEICIYRNRAFCTIYPSEAQPEYRFLNGEVIRDDTAYRDVPLLSRELEKLFH